MPSKDTESKQPKTSSQEKPTAPAKKPISNKAFKRKFYVPGFGFVAKGDTCTSEIAEAWKKHSPVKIENYLE